MVGVSLAWAIAYVLIQQPEPPFGGADPSINDNGKTVTMAYTDNNSGEDVIIRSDKADYYDNDIYFSVKNNTAIDQTFDIFFTLENDKTWINGIKEYVSPTEFAPTATISINQTKVGLDLKMGTKKRKTTVGSSTRGFRDSIGAGQTSFYKAQLIAPQGTIKQEFFIEAVGNFGGYGHLDPTFTANGNAQIDTAQSKFGGASGLFAAGTDSISTGNSQDWNFGTAGNGDFTVETWFRFNASSNTDAQKIVAVNNVGDGWQINYRWRDPGGGTVSQIETYDGVNDIFTTICTSQGSDCADNQWYHLEVSRSGGTIRVFLDGVSEGTVTDGTWDDGGSSLYIGNNAAGTNDFIGWLDEFRILKGKAAHTANFTPETAAYCGDVDGLGQTKVLLHMDGDDASTTFTDNSTTSCSSGASGRRGRVIEIE